MLIKLCPECGSGDVRFCNISVRPYCHECNHWAPVNFGTKEEAVSRWNTRVLLEWGDIIPLTVKRDYLTLQTQEKE